MGSCLSKADPPEKPLVSSSRVNNNGNEQIAASNNTNNNVESSTGNIVGVSKAEATSSRNGLAVTNNLNGSTLYKNGAALNSNNTSSISANTALSSGPNPVAGNDAKAADSTSNSAARNSTTVTANTVLDTGGDEDKNREFKILLLGSGESGKSTILKQMKILHQNGYTKEELVEYKPFVLRNVLDCAKAISKCYQDFDYPISMNVPLVNGAYKRIGKSSSDISTAGQNRVGYQHTNDSAKHSILKTGTNENDDISDDLVNPLTADDIELILSSSVSSDPNVTFDEGLVNAIASLWKANSTKNLLVEHKNQFYLMDSAKYFFQNLKRISKPNYVPDVTDVLRTRKKTSGIFETRFNMGNSRIHMVDVGGQRSERKKWIHCFDNVTIIIFCVALSEYDQTLLEEKSQNRLEESLVLFDSVVNSRWFSRTSIVLFLNKIDVFAEKLEHSPLENYFPDYTGGNDITKAAKYILWRFKQVNRSNLTIYPHVTQATDTSNIKVVFAAVQETILQNSLADSGIIDVN